MTWERVKPWLGTVIRLFLGAIWIWAAVEKLGSPRTFVQTVRAYDATPEWLSKAIGYGLPVLELCLGVLLVLGVATRLAAALSALLFVIFLVGIVEVAVRGIQLECGCFGGGGVTDQSTTYTLDILRDVGLLILAVYLIIWSFTRIGIEDYLARHDYVPTPSAKRMRTEQGRRKYEAAVAAARGEARTREIWTTASMAVLVVLISLIGIGVQSSRAKIQGSLTAKHASVSHGVLFGKKAAATIDLYEDFQCPHCLEFEKSAHATLDADVRANLAQIRFHPMAFLDASSDGNRYSSRAANAALCASDVSVDTFVAYHNLLYGTYKGKQVQPAEGTHGRTDAQLEKYAQAVGITGNKLTTFDSCVSSEQHKALVEAITENASENGANVTPTVKVNGHVVSATLAAVKKAIATADAHGPKPNPSKTPTPSPSPSKSPSATPTTSASTSGAKSSSSPPKSSSSASRKK